MIPIGDRLRSRTFPTVNYGLIAINFVLFFYELSLSGQRVLVGRSIEASPRDIWIFDWGIVPAAMSAYLHAPSLANVDVPLHIVTSMFIHAGWLHIIGNMLFLWVFGDNVEDALGHLRYLLFYLIGGIVAALAQMLTNSSSLVPVVGASGAIAAVLGAYLALYPRASVSVLVPSFVIPFLFRVPAAVMMVFWFVTQIVSLAPTANATGGTGGVAYLAHVGGFLFGLLLARVVATQRRSLPVL